jgi:hypothetical protein
MFVHIFQIWNLLRLLKMTSETCSMVNLHIYLSDWFVIYIGLKCTWYSTLSCQETLRECYETALVPADDANVLDKNTWIISYKIIFNLWRNNNVTFLMLNKVQLSLCSPKYHLYINQISAVYYFLMFYFVLYPFYRYSNNIVLYLMAKRKL